MDDQTLRMISGALALVCFLLLLARRARRKPKPGAEP